MQPQTVFDPSCHAPGESLVDLLRQRASAEGKKRVFAFLGTDGGEESSLTYAELDARARAIAAELQSVLPAGGRALLLFPPGLDFITAFFGCLYAGVAAVPAAVPSRHRLTTFVEAIFRASTPAVVLSTEKHLEHARRTYARHGALATCPWIAVDRIDGERQHAWRDLRVSARDVAFLQFTSGSTSDPRGVVLSHQRLIHNAALVQEAFRTGPESHGVFWLPLYHDMGLIGGVIQPVYCGGSSTLIAPAAFLQRPALWLETISRTRASISGGPDFAYDLCARKVVAEEVARLDLGCWELAFMGAERVRPQTADRFSRAFASCGFRREALFPCYGLAEATLLVSGGPRRGGPVVLAVKADALARNTIELGGGEKSESDALCRLIACGENLRGQRIVIVDPHTRLALTDGHVGEIWVQGPSVAGGYFENPRATEATFCACLADSGEGPFLRTGDLGFLYEGQLYVAGRLKNLIIIRGRNHYPEDIEQTIHSAYPGLRAGCCAAFCVEAEERDQLVIVQEIEPRRRELDTDAAIRAIRSAIAGRHEIEVHAVVLAKAGAVPKTSSGKMRRAACREKYLHGKLEIVASWKLSPDVPEAAANDEPADAPARHVAADDIEAWLIERITTRLRLAPGEIRVTTPFLDLGMGSLDAVEIAAALERWLGRKLSPTAIYNYPTIAALARWLAAPADEITEVASLGLSAHPPAELDPPRLLAEVRGMSDEDVESFLATELAKLPVK